MENRLRLRDLDNDSFVQLQIKKPMTRKKTIMIIMVASETPHPAAVIKQPRNSFILKRLTPCHIVDKKLNYEFS
jgi:hypothetical protein